MIRNVISLLAGFQTGRPGDLEGTILKNLKNRVETDIFREKRDKRGSNKRLSKQTYERIRRKEEN
ncbi:hypothetical protein SDC9_120753 [bioreactor metagenome]|uniref:Uncharacterized protein n=1 Tax=bioreactor metagenome TaxID=1076179 RepID=A0A645CA16_9ZZZZ